MRASKVSVLILTSSALLWHGCHTPPRQEMADARAAIAAAREAGAETAAEADLRAALDAMHRAEEALARGDYQTARRLAEQGRTRALTADRTARARRDAARREALTAIEALETVMAEARARVRSAETTPPATREGRMRVSDTRRAIVVANVALQKAREALSRDAYQTVGITTADAVARLRGVLAGKALDSPPGSRPER